MGAGGEGDGSQGRLSGSDQLTPNDAIKRRTAIQGKFPMLENLALLLRNRLCSQGGWYETKILKFGADLGSWNRGGSPRSTNRE